MTGPQIAVGVDPGPSFTAIVARAGEQLLTARVFDRDRLLPPLVNGDPLARRKVWAGTVLCALQETLSDVAGDCALPSAQAAIDEGVIVLGVEDVVAPNRYAGRAAGARDGIANVGPILETAVLLGVLLCAYQNLTFVRPRRNGQGPATAYPEGIRPRPRRPLGGPSEHARSAWDVAGTAAQIARLHRHTEVR
jgi:hypothetical protein